MDDKDDEISDPFYSEALKGWRIENKSRNESILVYSEAQGWLICHAARVDGWHKATRLEREINLKRAQQADFQREEARRQQSESPR